MKIFVVILLAVIANILIGFIWYMPKVFGTIWAKEVGLDRNTMKSQGMMKALSVSIVSSIVLALFLALLRVSAEGWLLSQFLLFSIVVWFVFVFCIRMSHSMFEQRSILYVAIVSGHDLLNILTTSVITYYAL